MDSELERIRRLINQTREDGQRRVNETDAWLEKNVPAYVEAHFPTWLRAIEAETLFWRRPGHSNNHPSAFGEFGKGGLNKLSIGIAKLDAKVLEDRFDRHSFDMPSYPPRIAQEYPEAKMLTVYARILGEKLGDTFRVRTQMRSESYLPGVHVSWHY